jgi:hypothetical protein
VQVLRVFPEEPPQLNVLSAADLEIRRIELKFRVLREGRDSFALGLIAIAQIRESNRLVPSQIGEAFGIVAGPGTNPSGWTVACQARKWRRS